MTPKNEVEHGVCSYCGADRSGPSAEAHEPNCLYAEPEPQGSDNSAGPGVPPSAELKERAKKLAREIVHTFVAPTELLERAERICEIAGKLEAFASSIQEEAETWKRILANRDETLVEMRQDLIVAKTQRDEFKQQLAEAHAQGMREAAEIARKYCAEPSASLKPDYSALAIAAAIKRASLSAETERKEKS